MIGSVVGGNGFYLNCLTSLTALERNRINSYHVLEMNRIILNRTDLEDRSSFHTQFGVDFFIRGNIGIFSLVKISEIHDNLD